MRMTRLIRARSVIGWTLGAYVLMSLSPFANLRSKLRWRGLPPIICVLGSRSRRSTWATN